MIIVYKAWRDGILSKIRNINYEFQLSGLWPVSFPAMQRHLKLFKDGSISATAPNPT